MSSTVIPPSELMRYAPAYVARKLQRTPDKASTAYSDPWIAAALFADISGFTPLSGRMAKLGSEGAERLFQILNAYFGGLIDIIDGHGADIARFAGDALLAFWPLESEEGLKDACQLAAQCALEIQKFVKGFEAPAGEKLQIKCGIGAGKVFTISLGGLYNRYECIVTGPGVIEACKAAASTQPGTCASGMTAWNLLGKDISGEPIDELFMRFETVHRHLPPRKLEWPVLGPEFSPGLLAFVPASIRRRLQVGQGTWIAELRRISVIFVNLPALTHEAPLEMAQKAMVAMQEEIYRYEGSVNKLGADEKGAMLVGALGMPPLSHEDDEARAALAGMKISQRLDSMNIEASVGVNSGMVFCGTIGNSIRCEYSVLGDPVNMTARLMAASHGSILCSESIYNKAKERLTWEVLGKIKVKGKDEPIAIFKPLAEAGRAMPARPTMPMVGRETEKAAVREAFTRLNADKRGGVIVVEGQAGIGKSRFINALLDIAGELALPTINGFAEAVQRTTPYYAFRPVFQHLFDLGRAARDVVKQRDLVLERLSFDPELVMLAPLLEPVLGLDFQDNAITAQLFGEGRVSRTNEVMVRLLARATAERPAVLVLEDCHWMDSASWQVAAHLAREVEPLAVVIATRPLADASAQRYAFIEPGPGVLRLALEPLSGEESLTLVRQRLGVDELPAPVADVLRSRAQGNPFFTEEVAYALLASGKIKVVERRCLLAPDFDPGTINLPDTVQGVVVSRIDRLDPRQQLTLKVASVVGRTFAFGIVRDVCPIEEDRAEQLANLGTLTEHQFVDLDAPLPERIYSFHHVITQEVAYQLMMPGQRRSLHRSVAEWYETHIQDLVPFYPLLAKHWTNTDQTAKAIEYLEKSGISALRDNANEEAVEFFTQAITLDKAAGHPSTALRRGTWHRMLAEATYNLGQVTRSLEHYADALELLEWPLPKSMLGFVIALIKHMAIQYFHRLFTAQVFAKAGPHTARDLEASRAYERLIQVYYLNNAKVESLFAAFIGLNLAERVGECNELARHYSTMAVMCGLLMMHRSARRYAERAQEWSDRLEHKSTAGYVAFIRGVYWVTVGDWELAEHDLALGAQIMKELGDRRHWAETAFTLANALSRKGKLHESYEIAVELAEFGKARGISQVTVWGLSWKLWSMAGIDPTSAGVSSIEQELSTVLETRSDVPLADQILGYGMAAAARWVCGSPVSALVAARNAEKIIRETGQVAHYLLCAYSCMARVYFELWLATNDPLQRDELEALLTSLCRTMRDFSLMYPIGSPRLCLARARLEWMRGHEGRTRRVLARALAEAERLDMPYETAQAHEMLARYGEPRERSRHEARAAEIYRRWRTVNRSVA